MHGHVPAAVMAREATRRKIEGPAPEPGVRRPRRAAARVLWAAALRLDPCLAAAPRPLLDR